MTKFFGQVVVGPPGSGKSTYCHAVQQFFEAFPRPNAIINLDPANDTMPYECSVDIKELVDCQDVMKALKLGPNGSLIYAMDYIDSRFDWLKTRLSQLHDSNTRTHLVFDMPGQVELYTHHDCVKRILRKLNDECACQLVVVNLSDAHYCSDPGKFISVLLSSLCTMIQLEMPLVNVLSKGDLLKQYGPLPFRLDYFMEAMDLRQLLQLLSEDPFTAKFNKLSERLVSVIEDYGLVSFMLLDVNDKTSMKSVLMAADKANGFVYHETDAPDMREILGKNSTNLEKFQENAGEKYDH